MNLVQGLLLLLSTCLGGHSELLSQDWIDVMDLSLTGTGQHIKSFVGKVAAIAPQVYQVYALTADSPPPSEEAAPPDEDPTPPPAASWWQPSPGLTWYWQLQGSIDMTQNVDVYDIDYLYVSKTVVDALHQQGKKVIAYVPAGNWEDFRPDSRDFPEEALCGAIGGWPGERYMNIRHPFVVQRTKERIALAASKGFDGIEGDVVDLHLVNTGCSPRISEAEMTAYLRELTDYAHSLGLAYFAKNAPETAASWAQFTDGVIVEEAYYYREAAAYMPYIQAGKPVFAVEYAQNTPTDSQCADARARGYALYGTDLALTGKVYKRCW